MIHSASTENIQTNRHHLVTLTRKWGDVNTDGLLDESSQTFSLPAVEGFIGYRIENSHAVVFGDPVCSPEDKSLLAKAFQEECNSKKLGVVYTIASTEFANWALKNLSAITIEFGKKFILDPFENPINGSGSHAVLVRKKVKHALSRGIEICEYREENSTIKQKISNLATAWVQKRKGLQVYLAHITLFNDRLGKRWFYAEQNGEVIGLLVLNGIEAKNGWLLNNVMMISNAPNGLSELLIVSVLQTLEKENCRYVLAGPVPGKQLGEINGANKGLTLLTRTAFQCAKWILHLDGYEKYWTKFDPKMEGSYLIFPQNTLGYSSVKALLSAYNLSNI